MTVFVRHKCLGYEVITHSSRFSNFRCPRITRGSYDQLIPTWSEAEKNPRWHADHILGNPDFELDINKWIQKMILLNLFSWAVLSAKFLIFLWERPAGVKEGYILLEVFQMTPKKFVSE